MQLTSRILKEKAKELGIDCIAIGNIERFKNAPKLINSDFSSIDSGLGKLFSQWLLFVMFMKRIIPSVARKERIAEMSSTE